MKINWGNLISSVLNDIRFFVGKYEREDMMEMLAVVVKKVCKRIV